MSDAALSALQKRNEELTAEVARLNAEGKTRRIANRKLDDELKQLRESVTSLTKQRDELQVKVDSGPKALNDEIASLKGQLLSRDHKDAFAGIGEFAVTAKDKDGKDVETVYTLRDGVNVDALWKNLEYKAEGDAPDADAVKGLLGKAVSTHGYLFQPKGETPNAEAGASTTAIGANGAKPGPGASRSGSTTSQRLSATAQIDAAFGDRPAGRIA